MLILRYFYDIDVKGDLFYDLKMFYDIILCFCFIWLVVRKLGIGMIFLKDFLEF